MTRNIINDSIGPLVLEELNRTEWDAYWGECYSQNLLQSWEYGDAKQKVENWDVRRILVKSVEGRAIAIVQILSRSLPFLGAICRINRGPLFIGRSDIAISTKAYIVKTIIKYACHGGIQIFFIAPELMDNKFIEKELRLAGLRKTKKPPWSSGLIDLSLPNEELFSNLNRRWKRMIRKSEEYGVRVRSELPSSDRIDQILFDYKALQKRNNFIGLSEKLIKALARQRSINWQFKCYVAEITNENGVLEEVGNRLVIMHGKSSSDLLVTSTQKGKEVEANSILYWNAILDAKNLGYNYFDIGGLGDNTPNGIADFKRGLNSELYKLIGEWWGISITSI